MLMALIMVLGLFPSQVFAAATYNAPTADPEELVID